MGACALPPLFWLGAMVCLCLPPPPTHTHVQPHIFIFHLNYVYISLTNNYLAFFIYQLVILWTISINWHRWLLVHNHISKYNLFILVLYWRYINYVYVCPPPPPLLFGTFLATVYVLHCYSLFIILWGTSYDSSLKVFDMVAMEKIEVYTFTVQINNNNKNYSFFF